MTSDLRFELRLYPDPVLRQRAEPVETFDEELRGVVDAMFARMAASKGVGLAAPQVGLLQRILIVNPSGEEQDNLVLVNPTITDRFGAGTVFEEGCLSFPSIYAEIERSESSTVTAYTAQGEPFEETFGGFTSRIVQHEFDHLEGVLLVDRMSPADKLRHKAALEELVESYKRARATVRAAGSGSGQ